MNAPLRRVGVVVMLLFGLLFANLNFVQAYRANEYRTSQYNGRVQFDEYKRQRGFILVGDGQQLALSKATDDSLKFQRSYPFGSTYAHVVGYKPVNLGAIGIEQSENEFLSGSSDKLFADRLRDIFTGDLTAGGNILLTLSRTAQETAVKELAGNKVGAKRGAVVALDPQTGAVKAMVSMPGFDPNVFTNHDTKAAEAAYKALEADPNKPLLNRATSENYFPASTFKVIVSAAALANGYNTSSLLPAGPAYTAPGTDHAIKNASPSICPGDQITLQDALTVSCNTAFAQLGVELGSRKLIETATNFGYYDNNLYVGNLEGEGVGRGLPVAESTLGRLTTDSGGDDKPTIALSSIGQASVKVTPLQAALIAASIANGGSQMRPYLVEQQVSPDLTSKIYTAAPKQLRRTCTQEVATSLQQMMMGVVQNGTGRNAQINGYQVGGKTGTAETEGDAESHGWFIGFALKDGQPVAAVAVFLENAGKGGSAEAARIAGRVMQGVIADKGGK